MDGDELGPGRCVCQPDGDRHLAAQLGIVRLELVGLNDELAAHEGDERPR